MTNDAEFSPESVEETSVEGLEVEIASDDYVAAEEPEVAEEIEAAAAATPWTFDRPVQTVGRRKEAVVRVQLTPGSGQFTLNGRTLEDYFPNKVHQQIVTSPLALLEREGQYDIRARLVGGGPSGQAGAMRLAVARALNAANPDDRGTLKSAGYLTRDARAVERKKAGLHKARRAPQYSKR